MAESKKNGGDQDELIVKITTSKVGLTMAKLRDVAMANKAKTTPVMRVYGTVSGCKAEQSDIGPYTAFSGNFKAVNLLTGSAFRSGKLLLPGVAENALAGSFQGQGEGKVLVFGLDLVIKYDEKAATAYVFGAVPVLEQQNDPIKELEKLLPAR